MSVDCAGCPGGCVFCISANFDRALRERDALRTEVERLREDLDNCRVSLASEREWKRIHLAEVERLREALRQIADGEVRPQPDESGWFSVANGVRMLARGAVAPLSEDRS